MILLDFFSYSRVFSYFFIPIFVSITNIIIFFKDNYFSLNNVLQPQKKETHIKKITHPQQPNASSLTFPYLFDPLATLVTYSSHFLVSDSLTRPLSLTAKSAGPSVFCRKAPCSTQLPAPAYASLRSLYVWLFEMWLQILSTVLIMVMSFV